MSPMPSLLISIKMDVHAAAPSLLISINMDVHAAAPSLLISIKMDVHAALPSLLISIKMDVKGKGSLYIAQYPVRWTAQSALHFLPPLADMFIPTPTQLLREAF